MRLVNIVYTYINSFVQQHILLKTLQFGSSPGTTKLLCWAVKSRALAPFVPRVLHHGCLCSALCFFLLFLFPAHNTLSAVS